MTSSLELVDEKTLNPEIEPWALNAGSLEAESQGGLEVARDYLQDIKALRTKIHEACDPVIDAAHGAHKAALAQRAQFEAPLIDAERVIKQKSATYIAAEEKKAREAAALEEATRQEALKRAEKEAEELQEMGEAELAQHVRDEAEADAAPAAQPQAPKAKGISTRTIWKAEVTDLEALVLAVASGDASIALLQPNDKVIGQMVRSLERQFKAPGIRVWSEKGIAVR